MNRSGRKSGTNAAGVSAISALNKGGGYQERRRKGYKHKKKVCMHSQRSPQPRRAPTRERKKRGHASSEQKRTSQLQKKNTKKKRPGKSRSSDRKRALSCERMKESLDLNLLVGGGSAKQAPSATLTDTHTHTHTQAPTQKYTDGCPYFLHTPTSIDKKDPVTRACAFFIYIN